MDADPLCRLQDFPQQEGRRHHRAGFEDRGFQDYKLSLNGSYSPMEYCVQYRETDFNFISRLMEQNGIFYFFQHEEGKHTMVIADSSSAHEPCPGQKSAGYNLVSGGIDEADVINSWNLEQELRSGKYTLTDYNFKTPSASLLATEPTIVSVGGNAGFEIFDYPGEYADPRRRDELRQAPHAGRRSRSPGRQRLERLPRLHHRVQVRLSPTTIRTR